ncbi:Clathrin assembly protein AP180 [Quillaja saponaria]|uniref:Clathrin assembly protein AP180 n=1 Tax=Quillaja saponaria TaxID=32244 RepID=A0AAD7KNK6_QUISA|nr:Clathrin assembly protein AP180 [Quillaja saponaria]
MRLWKRATGALKDKNSIWCASLSRWGKYRNPELEAVIIKATSHDESQLDYKNVHRVFEFISTSPICMKSLIWALSIRMEKTRSWVVALKGLILIHGVFSCNIPSMQDIGRLPFDLSNFTDRHSDPAKIWGYNAFIRAYFAYLDQRSAFVSTEAKKQKKQSIETKETLMEDLEKLKKLQALIDMLIQIQPQSEKMRVVLILEAMDAIIVEIFDVYSRFCNGIARVLMRIYDQGRKVEAAMGLMILQRAATQGDELSLYFEFCRDIGVINASQWPKIERIPDEEIQELEKIINGASQKRILDGDCDCDHDLIHTEEKAVVVSEKCDIVEYKGSNKNLKTVITDKWEVFDEDLMVEKRANFYGDGRVAASQNPYADPFCLVPRNAPAYNQVLPDLISL